MKRPERVSTMPDEEKKNEKPQAQPSSCDHDAKSAWSRHAAMSLRGCGCGLAFLTTGCCVALVAALLCLAALLMVLASCFSFVSNLLFGAA